jgi:hypothetical protein
MGASSARRTGALVAFAIALGLGLGSSDARAYCRTSSCGDAGTGARCVPAAPSDCGKVLAWPTPCVSFSMQEDASREIGIEQATAIATKAFAAWTSAACPDGRPRIEIDDLGPVACDEHEYNQHAGNANIILFREDGWPHVGVGDALALTTVTYNVDTGAIYDADMEINATDATFSTGDTGVTFDLQSILTHEAGHFLGLSHSTDLDATMFADYVPGSTSLRTLDPDDVAAICAAYPPGPAIPSSCDPEPRHGFSSECQSAKAVETGGCCGVAPGAPADHGLAIAAGLLGVAAASARRRRRS